MGGNTVSTGFGKYVRNYGIEEGKLVKVTKKGGIWWSTMRILHLITAKAHIF